MEPGNNRGLPGWKIFQKSPPGLRTIGWSREMCVRPTRKVWILSIRGLMPIVRSSQNLGKKALAGGADFLSQLPPNKDDQLKGLEHYD
jgi:hypothetical protein